MSLVAANTPGAFPRPALKFQAEALRLAAGFAAALAWTILLRLPLISRDGPDDAFYAVVAHLWTRGALPYAGVYDIKPPGFFAALAAAQTIFGPNLLAERSVAIFSDALSAVALYGLGKRLASPALGVFAAALFPIVSMVAVADDAYCPLVALTTLAFAAALGDAPILRRAALAGLAIGAALTFKQTAAFEALALAAILLRAPNPTALRWRVALGFASAAAAAPALALGYFAWHGAAGALVEDVVALAMARPRLIEVPFFATLATFAIKQMPVAPLFACAGAVLARRRPAPDDGRRAAFAALAMWFAAACLGILAQRATANDYVAPAIAPALLLAGAAFAGAPWRLAGLAALAALAAPLGRPEVFDRPYDARAVDAAAALIRASGPAPDDKLFVIDQGTWLYIAADLAPPTRFVHAMHLLCKFPDAGPVRLKEALATRPRYVAIGARDGAHNGCIAPASWGIVPAELGDGYRLIGQANGAHESYDIYEARGDAALRRSLPDG